MWTFDDDDEDVAAAERARRIINEMRSEGCPPGFIWVVVNEALLLLIAEQSGDGSKRIEQHGKVIGMIKAGLLAMLANKREVPLQDEAAQRRYIADIDAEAERFLFNSR